METLESRWLLAATDVVMWHNDLARTGLNPNEQVLTPSNVNSASFGKLLSYPVTGQVYGQPLYLSDFSIPGAGTRDVVFVVTMNNDVYALDANSTSGPTGGVLWHVNLGRAADTPSPFIGFRYGPFRDASPQVGITSTPVIDRASGTMFIDAFTNDVVGQDAYSHRIHALDLATGQPKVAPKLVVASVPGNGTGGDGTTVPFAANRQIQRAALTMFDGVLYAAYGAFADTDPYHGWILGFDPSTLNMVSVFNTTPNNDTDTYEGEGGIWQSGAGLTSDGTHLYVETGNGDFNPAVHAYSDSVLKLAPTAGTNPNGSGMSLVDYFTPYNEQALADADADLGSAGAIALPDQPGQYPHLLAAIGKQGIIYLLNRDDLGQHSPTTDRVVQKVNLGKGFWGSPAYFNQSLYYHAVNDVLKRFSLSNGLLSAAPAAQSTVNYPTWPGATPSVSANGTANGIVWDVQFETARQVLHAYDATTLVELYNSKQNAARDQMGGGVKFITPTIADGRVFVGSSGELTIYGLIQPVTTPPAMPSNFAATAQTATSVKLTWVDDADNESGFKIERSTDGVSFAQIDLVGVDSRSYLDAGANPNTQYHYRIRATNAVGDSAYAPAVSVTTPASTGVSHFYKFDAGSGTAVADSANANNGALAGAAPPAWVAGRTGGALSFAGNGAYNQAAQGTVALENDLSPILGSTSTLVAWIRTTQSGNAVHWQSPAITGVERGASGNDINWGVLDRTGRIGLFVGTSGGVYSTRPVNDGQWHNVAMTRDAVTGRVQIFIDGILNATHVLEAGNKTTPFSQIGALRVAAADGVTVTGANHFNGQLDDLRIYNTVLGAAEISAVALVPATPVITSATVAAGPVAHLAFTSGSSFAESIEVYRKVGVNGTFAKLATLPGVAAVFDDTTVAQGTSYYYYVKAVDQAGASPASNIVGVTPAVPTIVGIYAFYNDSKFDGQNGSSNVTDRTAIATDKRPLFPGQTASFANYTTYANGLTGIIIDV
ncbi:MAG TPA: LamG-like jellyroll fold domain-containing protein, partial [Tepidisphaeraceae bacterium]|nr:LamG-like jellyroll fold domain-containing protein [Tepidisphaeraceae bacterium]